MLRVEIADLYEHVRSGLAQLNGVRSDRWMKVTLDDDEHDHVNRSVSIERQLCGHGELLNQCIGFFGERSGLQYSISDELSLNEFSILIADQRTGNPANHSQQTKLGSG